MSGETSEREPGYIEWTAELKAGDTGLSFSEWKKFNAKRVKSAKRRIKAQKEREKERNRKSVEKMTFEPAPQAIFGDSTDERQYDIISTGVRVERNSDYDGYQSANWD